MSPTPPPRRRRTRGSDSSPSEAQSDDACVAPSPAAARVLVVDRREGRTFVLIADDGATIEVSAARLPKTCRAEGAVLRVPTEPGGTLRWAEAVRDHAEEARRLEDLSRRAERLRRSDPGGDVVL